MNFMSNDNRQGMRSFSQSYSTPSSSSSSLPHALSFGHELRENRGSLEDGCASPTVTPNNAEVVEREHMFDKVVTPSDVGKLNRLVIPKQHAEKYFPLDSSTNEKGLLLNFEDRNGKSWRFRYSYWNSSQSYVMTKGWSRFVKDKKLDAGDIVSFHRGIGELGKDRLFIDWRRRPNPHQLTAIPGISHLPNHFPGISHLPNHHFPFHRSVHHQSYPAAAQAAAAAAAAWNYHHAMFAPPPAAHSPTSYGYNNCYGAPNYPFASQFNTTASGSVIYHRSGGEEAAPPPNGGGAVYESVPVVQGKAAAKRLRLFGVNMDCPIPESDGCDYPSSSSAPLISYHLSSSSYGDGPSDLDSPIDKAKTSSSMSLDLDI